MSSASVYDPYIAIYHGVFIKIYKLNYSFYISSPQFLLIEMSLNIQSYLIVYNNENVGDSLIWKVILLKQFTVFQK